MQEKPARQYPEVRIGLKEIWISAASVWLKFIKTVDYLIGSLIAKALWEKEKKPFGSAEGARNILVIRPGGIGDAIFLLPVLRRIKISNPSIAIDVLCEQRNVSVFQSQESLCREVYCYNRLGKFWTCLKKKYAVVIDTEQWHYLSALVSYFIKSDYTVGFGSRQLRAKLFNQSVAYDLKAYELDNFQVLFQSIFGGGESAADLRGSFVISEDSGAWARERISLETIVFCTASSVGAKRMKRDQVLHLIKHVLFLNKDVFLIGGKDAVKENTLIERRIGDKRLQNWTGKTSLLETAALIKASQLFVGVDSGILHLAVAVGTPAIGIFGPTDPKKWGPRGEKGVSISCEKGCSPCAAFSYTLPSCKGSFDCMKDIGQDIIIDEMDKVLNKERIDT